MLCLCLPNRPRPWCPHPRRWPTRWTWCRMASRSHQWRARRLLPFTHRTLALATHPVSLDMSSASYQRPLLLDPQNMQRRPLCARLPPAHHHRLADRRLALPHHMPRRARQWWRSASSGMQPPLCHPINPNMASIASKTTQMPKVFG